MKLRLLVLCLLAALLAAAGLLAAVATSPPPDVGKSVASIGLFKADKWTDHYRVPRDDQALDLLERQGVKLGTPAATARALKSFRQQWAERNPTTPNPRKFQRLLRAERRGATLAAAPQIKSLVVPVEFAGTDVFEEGAVTITGPLHNEIPAPGPRDNNTVWYDDATPALYKSLYFGVGPKAGVVVHHPNLGTVDLRGNTMANYFLEQSEGKFVPKGTIYPKWLQAAHSEGWYGEDSETSNNIRAWDLVREVVDGVNADDPDFPWQNYDADGNGFVDNFTVIHAGQGQEAGGGPQGAYAIWSHASAVDYPTGYLACAKDSISPGVPAQDIYVREYSMDPENIDVGVISEEFGHAAFGLPDIYTLDADASPANWAIMEAGSWNGILGGMQPAPFPLQFRIWCGWAKPKSVSYATTKPTVANVGQLSLRPAGTAQGLKIDLPDKEVVTDNPLGTGKAWWGESQDLSDNTLTRHLDLTGRTAPTLSFASYWDIEEDWDYGYVEVSTDAGSTWTSLQDMDARFRDTNPNGNNLGWGLTGTGSGTIRVDLTPYAGGEIDLRLRFVSDMAVTYPGWWADDFAVTDGATTVWADDVESGDAGWTPEGWRTVPVTDVYPRYYLAEWRNNSGFDRGLKYPYSTVYSNDANVEWQVDRAPYTVPGMVLWFRDASYKFDYDLYGSLFDDPSVGPKHALTVIDSHYWPYEWNGWNGDSGAHRILGGRVQAGNAAFTLQQTKAFTLRRPDSTATGNVVEVKTFGPQPAVSQFHDALGYFPGLRYRELDDGLYFWDWDASAAVPATGPYTTKITWGDKTPAEDLYGADIGVTVLGSGDPRDSGVQYGVNIAVLQKARNGSWGKLAVWNAKSLVKVKVARTPASVAAGGVITYTLTVTNRGPAAQSFRLENGMPKGATYRSGKYFNAVRDSIVWKGKLASGESKQLVFSVRVASTLTSGDTVENTALVYDDASGSMATVKTTVK